MKALGYIDRYEDNTFRAENNITYNEAIKIIVEMLNYVGYAKEMGGYPEGYIEQAKKLGITDGLLFDGSSPATRGDVILMVAKTLDIPHIVITKYNVNSGGQYKESFIT